ATADTNADGFYLFDDLIAGDYIVEFVSPEDFVLTEQNKNGVDDALNSDANPATGRTEVITLGNESVTTQYTEQTVNATEGIDPTWDAGFVPAPEPTEPNA